MRYLAILVLLASSAFGQLWSDILDPTRAIDWSGVGVVGGIPARATHCSNLTTASTCAQINTALSSCTTGQTVFLAAGTYSINCNLSITSNVTLRGAGADQTILNVTVSNGNGAVLLGSNVNSGPSTSNDVSIASGLTRGSTSIVVSSAANISVGKLLTITELNDLNYGVTALGSEGLCTFCDPLYSGTRTLGQTVLVTNVSGTTVTISPGLYKTYGGTLSGWAAATKYPALSYITNGGHYYQQTAVTASPYICTGGGSTPSFSTSGGSTSDGSCSWTDMGVGTTTMPLATPFTPAATSAGVENLTVYATDSGAGPSFVFGLCKYCWIKGVEANYTDGDYVTALWSYGVEIDNSYFSGTFSHTSGDYDSAVNLRNMTSSSLVQNNICERSHVCFMLERGASGNVIAYNYALIGYDISASNVVIGGTDYHGAHPYFNLHEGDVIVQDYLDSIWGSSGNNTFFREWVQGSDKLCSPFTDSGARQTVNCGTNHYPFQASRDFQVSYLSLTNNFVGAVVGSTAQQSNVGYSGGVTSVDSITAPTNRVYDTTVYGWTFGYAEAGDSGTWALDNGNAATTAFQHGIYSNITGTTTWATGVTHTLPASFYLSAKPSWWGSLAYPSIGPDVTGGTGPGGHSSLTISNPAMNCYYNVMGGADGGPGSPLTFNANTCYAVVATTARTIGGGHKVGGGRSIGVASGGAPLTYNARTDNCVTGSEAGCVSGATTGQVGSAMSFQYRSTDTIPFADQAPANTAVTDPDFGTYMVQVTDATTSWNVSPWQASWNMQSQGQWDAWSADEKMLLVTNTGGGAKVLFVDPAKILAKTCSPASPCITDPGIYTGNQLAVGGSFTWDTAVSNTLYEMGSAGTSIIKKVINPSTYVVTPTTYVDFTSDTPVSCSALPSNYRANWIGSFSMAKDGSTGYALAGGQEWTANWTVTTTETYIMPSAETSNWIYQATNTGVTGSSTPTKAFWDACKTSGTCTEGTQNWAYVGLSTQGSGFDVVQYHPATGCIRINSRLGKVYLGTGNTAFAAGLIQTNEDINCTRYANGGTVTKPCPMADRFTLHEASQPQNGQYITMGTTATTPSSGDWNQFTLTCQASNAAWSGAYSSTHPYALHNVVSYGGYYYSSLASNNTGNEPDTAPSYWVESEKACYEYWLDVTTGIGFICSDYNVCTGHAAQGYLNVARNTKYNMILYSNPVINGVANPGTALLATAFPTDNHGTWRNSGTSDLTPMFASVQDVPTATINYTAACYGELCAVKPDGSNTLYRIAHLWNTGSTPMFQIHNAICVVGPLGDLVACGIDVMGTRGATTAQATTCNNLQGKYGPTSGLTLTTGDTLFPTTGNAGSYIYTVTGITGSGTTTSTQPTWDQTVGNTVTYALTSGSAALINSGTNNCRGDIVIFNAVSAHAAP